MTVWKRRRHVMIKVADVVDAMNRFAPVELAEEWDNVGLLVGNSGRDVSKIIVMLDLDEKGLKEALEVGADMIITHHPFIMSKLSNITDPVILGLIENKISVCSMHTNLDCADGGVNQVLAETIGLDNIEPVVFGDFIARGGVVEKNNLENFIVQVKKTLNIDNLRYVGEKKNYVEKVCVVGGSGGDFIEEAYAKGFDTIVTADVKYHQAQLSTKLGMNVIDAGHFETENPVIYKVARYLREVFDDVEVITSLRTKSYIKYE